MTLLKSTKIAMGEGAKDFSLKGVDDKTYSLASFKEASVLVVIFMCNHCPYVQAVWGRLVDLQEKFKDRGVQFIGINPNFHPDYPEDSMENMKKYYSDYGMNFPYLQDKTQEVARAYGAVCTPDIFVYDKERKLAYHGEELAEALEALLGGDRPGEDQHPTMGCSVKWRE